MARQAQHHMWIKLIFVLSIFGRSVLCINYPNTTCGLRPLMSKTDPPGRIVGGTVAKRGDWPWVVSLTRNGNHFCGGSLINHQWIITAAHCIPGTTTAILNSMRVVFGLHDRLTSDSWVIQRGVQRIVVHPQYSSQTLSNDIALIQLSTTVDQYTEYYMPICFPSVGQAFHGQTGHTVGWGAPYYGGSLLRYLSEVATPIVNDAECRGRYTAGRINTDKQVCSGGGQTGACQGDSGGPFTVADATRNGRHVLVGLTSWGIGCGDGGVYTRVSAYKSWVESIAGPTLS